MAGMHVALAVDSCPEALKIHAANHPDCKHLCVDLPSSKLPLPKGRIHIHASPPCTTFSTLNRNAPKASQRKALELIRWSVRYAKAHATTWTLEQVGSPEVKKALIEEGCEEGVDFDIFYFEDFGLPQCRKRLIAGSPRIIQALHSLEGRIPERGVSDVIRNCRGRYIRNCTVSTYKMKHGVRTLIPVTESHPSFARPISEPAYTVTGNSPLRWWSPGDETCSTFTPAEMAAVQGFPRDYRFHTLSRTAYLQIGNAVPPLIMWLIVRSLT